MKLSNRRGTQKKGLPPQPDDHEPQHVLIVGSTQENVNKATYLVEKVLYSDEETRNRIKDEQMQASNDMRTELLYTKMPSIIPSMGLDGETQLGAEFHEYLMTPYGPPDKNVLN